MEILGMNCIESRYKLHSIKSNSSCAMYASHVRSFLLFPVKTLTLRHRGSSYIRYFRVWRNRIENSGRRSALVNIHPQCSCDVWINVSTDNIYKNYSRHPQWRVLHCRRRSRDVICCWCCCCRSSGSTTRGGARSTPAAYIFSISFHRTFTMLLEHLCEVSNLPRFAFSANVFALRGLQWVGQ